MAAIFERWNKTELDCYLFEITANLLAKKDNVTAKGHILNYVLDKTGRKGMGRWTSHEVAEQSVAAATMDA